MEYSKFLLWVDDNDNDDIWTQVSASDAHVVCSNPTTVTELDWEQQLQGKGKRETSERNNRTERRETDEAKRKARNSRAESQETAVTRRRVRQADETADQRDEIPQWRGEEKGKQKKQQSRETRDWRGEEND